MSLCYRQLCRCEAGGYAQRAAGIVKSAQRDTTDRESTFVVHEFNYDVTPTSRDVTSQFSLSCHVTVCPAPAKKALQLYKNSICL